MNEKINEESMAARLIKAQRDIDALKPQRSENRRQQEKSCGGCSGRCFCVSEAEYALILDYLTRNLSEDEVFGIISKARAQWESVQTHCPAVAEMLEGIITLEELLKMDEITLPFPCVFYSEGDGGCLVYEVRPLVCRAYGIGCLEETERGIFGKMFSGRVSSGCPPDFYKKLLSFLFFGNAKGGCVIIRRPAPLFYYFNIVFRNTDPGQLPEIEFCRDLLYLSEKDYINKLVETCKER